MQVIELSPDDRVQMAVRRRPTGMGRHGRHRRLKEDGGETVLLCTHADGREPAGILHHTSTQWATFLIGLRAAARPPGAAGDDRPRRPNSCFRADGAPGPSCCIICWRRRLASMTICQHFSLEF
jgi:hypothetical protein